MDCLQIFKEFLSQELNDCIYEEALSSTWGSWVPRFRLPHGRSVYKGGVLFHLECTEVIKFFI